MHSKAVCYSSRWAFYFSLEFWITLLEKRFNFYRCCRVIVLIGFVLSVLANLSLTIRLRKSSAVQQFHANMRILIAESHHFSRFVPVFQSDWNAFWLYATFPTSPTINKQCAFMPWNKKFPNTPRPSSIKSGSRRFLIWLGNLSDQSATDKPNLHTIISFLYLLCIVRSCKKFASKTWVSSCSCASLPTCLPQRSGTSYKYQLKNRCACSTQISISALCFKQKISFSLFGTSNHLHRSRKICYCIFTI